MTASLGDVFGGLAFFLSIYATIKTIKFNERQKALIEAQEKLTNLQLTKEKSPAKNVRIEFPDNNSPVSMSDVESKFPFESLVAYQSVDLIASGELGRASKFTVRLIWDDDFQDGNESVVHVTY